MPPKSLVSAPVLAAALLSLAHPPFALAEGARQEDSRPRLANPFVARYESGPGLLAINLQAGSLHGDGLGLSLGVVPWGYLELKATYAYWTEHSVGALVKVNILPRALLTPYLPLGYTAGIAPLPYGITLFTHRVFAGLGLQARMLGRYFVGAEVTANVVAHQELKDKMNFYTVGPAERVVVRAGAILGVYLL